MSATRHPEAATSATTARPVAAARLTVAVVNYRTPELALSCLELVRRSAPGADLRLVDADPDPGFADALSRSHPDVAYLGVPNHSYAHAVNAGLRGASTEYVAFMNADVIVADGTFPDLVAALESSPQAAAAGPFVADGNGKPQGLGPLYARHYRRLRRSGPTGGRPAAVAVPWLSGCLTVARLRDWRELGGYDEAFRFYNEDLDFGLRVSEAGRSNLLVATPVVHLGGTSTPSHPAFALEGRRGGLLVGRRHYPGWLRAAQVAFVASEAALGRVLARTPGRRAANAELLRMLRAGDVDATPFGATLDERPEW